MNQKEEEKEKRERKERKRKKEEWGKRKTGEIGENTIEERQGREEKEGEERG